MQSTFTNLGTNNKAKSKMNIKPINGGGPGLPNI